VSTTLQDGHGFVANSGLWIDLYAAGMHAAGTLPVIEAPLMWISRQGVSVIELCRHKMFGSLRPAEEAGTEDLSSSPGSRKRAREDQIRSAGIAPKPAGAVFTGTVPTGKEKQIIDEFVMVSRKIGKEAAESKFAGRKGFAFLTPTHVMHPYYCFHLNNGGV
jgi:hypothetical protein